MIVSSQSSKVESSGIEVSNAFSIARTPHMFNILSSGLYSDKIGAVLREVGCNAHDAHVSIGKGDVPIEVKLPYKLDLTFYVKDFGPGLSDENLRRMYTTYGWSDKQNDNKVTGGFGLGSKSPFAYTGQLGNNSGFTVVSVHGGVERSYVAYLDESGTPTISRIGERPASPEWTSGVKVEFVVKQEDIDEFQSKAYAIFRWFETKPNLLGAEAEVLEKLAIEKQQLLCEAPLAYHAELNYPGSSWAMQNDILLVMGGVAYPTGYQSLDGLKPETKQFFIALGPQIIVHVPIGSLPVTPSRESLQMTKEALAFLVGTLETVAEEAEYRMGRWLLQMPGELMWDYLRRVHKRASGPLRTWASVCAGPTSKLAAKIRDLTIGTYMVPYGNKEVSEDSGLENLQKIKILPKARLVTARHRRNCILAEIGEPVQRDIPISLSLEKVILAFEDCNGYLSGLKSYAKDLWDSSRSMTIVLFSGSDFSENEKQARSLAGPGGALEGAEVVACSSVKLKKAPVTRNSAKKVSAVLNANEIGRRPKSRTAQEFYADVLFQTNSTWLAGSRESVRYGDLNPGTVVFAITPEERVALKELREGRRTAWKYLATIDAPKYWVSLTAAEASKFQVVELGHMTWSAFRQSLPGLAARPKYEKLWSRTAIRTALNDFNLPWPTDKVLKVWKESSALQKSEIAQILAGTSLLQAFRQYDALQDDLAEMEGSAGSPLEDQDFEELEAFKTLANMFCVTLNRLNAVPEAVKTFNTLVQDCIQRKYHKFLPASLESAFSEDSDKTWELIAMAIK